MFFKLSLIEDDDGSINFRNTVLKVTTQAKKNQQFFYFSVFT